ncbi:LuxR C-terminal-related transcriptional regulator [Amycolatopsis pigmentata]|uniref:LuxR C-terminal-related transcriptional regulator n=1 Tax=Amycolatopsis pigmentata TaxID=450801 RepID=A0ABW5FP40_9PSEU
MAEATGEQARRRVPRIKITAPAVPSGFVVRPRLLSVLDQAREVMTVLVCAPAGSGKTLLLADWARGHDGVAWVSLDSDDNDDRRFWSAILGALEACETVPSGSALRTLAVPRHPSRDLGFLAKAVGAIEEVPVTVWLVLDDLHELTDPEPLHGLETLMRHQPAGLRLVLASRHNPPLPLARLRLADQLVEIRAGDLRFSPDEARALLSSAGVELLPEQARQLLEQTEGWAAGLRLAAASLSEAADPDRFLAEFAENDRAVADYLIDEVLSRLPDELRAFLRAVSVCDEVCAELAEALSGRADAATMLDTLERKTSLLTRAGAEAPSECWYRVHALVRSVLLAEVSRTDPHRAAALHTRAAGWFAAHGRPVRALAHAARTSDAGQVAGLLRREAVTLVLAGEHDALRRALAVLGDQLIAEESLFALVSAFLQLEQGEPELAALHLAHADAAWPAEPSAEVETLRRLVRSRQAQVAGDVDEMVRTTDELERRSARGPVLDAVALLHRGTALMAAGDRDEARDHLRTALAAARDRGQDYVAIQCLTALGWIAGSVGDYPLMNELAGEADSEATRRGWEQTVAGAAACVLLAYGALLRGDPAACVKQAGRAGRLAVTGSPPGIQSLNLLLGVLIGAARFELGDWTGGLRRLHEARLAVGDARLPVGENALSAVLEHRAAVRFGLGELAQEVLGRARTSLPESGEIALMRARAQLVLGRPGPAAKILRPVLDGVVPTVLPWSVAEAWLVETEIARQAGDQARAVTALTEALSVSKSLGVLFPLVTAAPEIIELISARRGELGGLDDFAADVLATRRALGAPPVPAPLTKRERSVLRLLPTLRSLDEIAQDLTVSPNTVKTHVRSIYAKLGVKRRRDAVSVAVERGLLDTPYPPLDG